ncbi:FAD/FMN-containing dehydrogenase [Actinomadura cellulosilytica]|uniref:FAD/FMN-containing dehydrogenase n=1 Tax=Thermomonospora cellulosilytica TaxID=1411118 RepID=A0A7W3R6A7_9ACTN|nr:FAD-dependent oxidoreductase [Thermomonospora cellulosilytica]MBA9001933.1 FAD/FMN-containing dehydrogenase [Thermomonospora cellulosilytica]
MYGRRDVLRAGAQITAGGMAAGLVGAASAEARPWDPAEPAAWSELQKSLSPRASLYRPGDPEYARLAPPWNMRYDHLLPAGVVVCADRRDVQAALRWAAKHGMPLTPRSGGHNYAGHSTTSGLLVSLRRLRHVTADGRRLWVGGGATNSDVFQAGSTRTGLYFPGGRCTGVGVAGLTLGGGLGFNDRKWGLTCDRLVATEVVLADGTVVRAGAAENADLYWACRGGAGGNFGINTGFLFEAVDVSRTVATVFDLVFELRHAAALLEIVQEILQRDVAGNFDIRFGMINHGDGRTAVTMLGQYLGDETTTLRLLAPLLAYRPSRQVIRQDGFWQAQGYLSEGDEREAMASRSLVPGRWLDRATVEAVAERIRTWRPEGRGNTVYVTLFAMGGATATVDPHETAFPHRDATFVIDVGTTWRPATTAEGVRSLLAQTRAVHTLLRTRLGTNAAYVNFPDPEMADWRTAYYGAN